MPVPTAEAPEPDPALVTACQRGDRKALDTLLRAEAPRVERLIRRLVGPSVDAAELLQATLVAAVEAFPRYRGEASVRTWLSRIAVNIVRAELRRPLGRRQALRLVSAREAAEPSDPAATPERSAEGRDLLRKVYAHLDELGPRQRVAFVLHVVDGNSLEEVAALMGASHAATKSRVFLARHCLLARLRRDRALSEALVALMERS